MSFTVTGEVKMMFQYKVIQNVLPTRATLYRSGIFEKPIYAKNPLCNAEE